MLLSDNGNTISTLFVKKLLSVLLEVWGNFCEVGQTFAEILYLLGCVPLNPLNNEEQV